MRNYNDSVVQEELRNKFARSLPIDICIATYNRLPYLEKCIWSLLAATQLPFRLHIGDDGSTDGTRKFIDELQQRGLVHVTVYNNRAGTAENFNSLIKETTSEIIVILTDDKYIYRGWELACLDILDSWKKAVGVNFFNYTRLGVDKSNRVVTDQEKNLEAMQINKSGMGATLMYKRWFYRAGQFQLPGSKKMGFFATPFCKRLKEAGGKMMSTYPVHYAQDMDIKTSKLKEIEYGKSNGYFDMRLKYKGAPNRKDKLSTNK